MKDYNVTAYVLLKTEFKQPTKDIYKLAKITEDFCKESINDARKKSIKFRNWFDKNFSPKSNDDENPISDEPKTEVPKVPTYIPPEKKEAIKEKVVAEPQKQDSDAEKGQVIAERIMKIRDLLGNDSYGASVIAAILKENYTSADIMSWNLSTQNKLDSLTKDM